MTTLERQDLIARLERAETLDEIAEIEAALGVEAETAADERWLLPTLADVAQLLGVHEQTVKNWRGEGLPGEEGRWDMRAIIQWRIAKAEKRGLSIGDESERALLREKTKLDIERKRLELDEKAGKLVYRDAVHGELEEILSIVRVRLQAVPGEIAASVPSEVRGLVMEESSAKVITALKELARCSLVPEGPPDVVFQA